MMTEREHCIETGSHRLRGTLCLPAGAGPFPVETDYFFE
jgi:hypothetical protein